MFLKQPNINSPMTEVPIDLRHERVKGIDENLNISWSLYLPRPIDSFCQNLELYLVNLIGNVTKIFLYVVSHAEAYLEPYQTRSSLPVVSCEKGVLKNFAKFTGKHLR